MNEEGLIADFTSQESQTISMEMFSIKLFDIHFRLMKMCLCSELLYENHKYAEKYIEFCLDVLPITEQLQKLTLKYHPENLNSGKH